MRLDIQLLMMIGCLTTMMAIPACSLADDAPTGEREPSTTRTWESEPGQGKGDEATAVSVADDPAPGGSARPVAECTGHNDCTVLPRAAHWCSPEGHCEYTCEPGFADANGEDELDGCECEVRHEGRDLCDGHDSDCDGVVDNPFAGGTLAAGRSHSCATDGEGRVHCWGPDWAALSPEDVDSQKDVDSAEDVGASDETEVRLWKLSAGAHHSCGLSEAGRVYCWGDNAYGKLGRSDVREADRPISAGTDERFVDLAVGGDHSCGLTRGGQIKCWGRNDYGQLGDSTLDSRSRPRAISASLEFEAVAAGDFHTCALAVSGRVLCWGANLQGQVGLADVSAVDVPTPVEAPADFVGVTVGANHSCALDVGGMVYCWGDNEHGQLADASVQRRPEARPIDDAEFKFSALTAGGDHTCGLTNSGALFCWGHNGSGRLGIEQAVASSAYPRRAAGDLHFEQVAAGGRHSCARTADGLIYCWGEGAQGQLWPGSTHASRSPARADCR